MIKPLPATFHRGKLWYLLIWLNDSVLFQMLSSIFTYISLKNLPCIWNLYSNFVIRILTLRSLYTTIILYTLQTLIVLLFFVLCTLFSHRYDKWYSPVFGWGGGSRISASIDEWRILISFRRITHDSTYDKQGMLAYICM